MEMHRSQATTPGEAGWYLAESTHGSFSVLVPIPFNDFTMTGSDPKIGTFKTCAVGAQSTNGIKFSVTETPITPGMTQPDIDKVPQALAKNGQTVSDVVKEPFSRLPSTSFSVTGSSSGAYIRCVRTQTSLIMLILEYPAARQAEAALLKSRFLDSLKIKPPNQSLK